MAEDRTRSFLFQYAMSRIAVDDLDSAETYLETAVGLAKERGKDYSPFQILDQRARLFLIKNTKKKEVSVREVTIAIKDLSDLLSHKEYEIIYPFRSAPLLSELLDKHVDNLSVDLRRKITEFLTALKDAGANLTKLPRSQKGETKVLTEALKGALLTIRNS